MKHYFCIALLMILFTLKLSAQDSLSIKEKIHDLPEDKSADSIISKSISEQETLSLDTVLPVVIDSTQTVLSDIPDSVYIARIRSIPFAISLTYNDIVKAYIEVYTIRKRDKLQEMLYLKDYYFPIFESVLDANGMPLELKYLSVIESALNPRAVSRCGATGLWQFMYGTGRLYNLTINSFIDERRDPYAATVAAAKYLKALYTAYGDWVLAIAAYNCGPGNVNRAIHRSGGKTNYWDIYPFLPRETRGYVPAFIAAAYAMNFYKEHNLAPIAVPLPPDADTVMVNENIHLQQVADVLNIPIDQLVDLNPQYRYEIVPGRYASCPLRLPTASTTQFVDLEDSIIRYKHDQFFSGDFKLIVPTSFRNGRYGHIPSLKYFKRIFYTVKQGETMSEIAQANQIRLSDLKSWNDIYHNTLRSGQVLVLYVPKKKASNSPTAIADTSSKIVASADGFIYYQVKTGDSLWKIANQFPGVTDEDIRKWNNLTSGNKILPGQTIKIKKMN